MEFLSIDHVEGGGSLERRRGHGTKFYSTLLRTPLSDKYRVLCMNCNFAIGKYGYCPHKENKTEWDLIEQDSSKSTETLSVH